jgi:hypothetical protein
MGHRELSAWTVSCFGMDHIDQQPKYKMLPLSGTVDDKNNAGTVYGVWKTNYTLVHDV